MISTVKFEFQPLQPSFSFTGERETVSEERKTITFFFLIERVPQLIERIILARMYLRLVVVIRENKKYLTFHGVAENSSTDIEVNVCNLFQ